MPHTLLLADDSVTIRRVIELTFTDENVRVISVSSGREALDRIAADRPDIVLADIGMADVSGYEIAAFIKGRDDLRHIPVVLLAGAFEPLDEAKARQAGSDAVLVKPFEPQMVVARVRELLARPAAAPSSRSMALDPEPVRAASGSTDTDPLFDESLDRLDAAFAGAHGPSLDAEVVSDFAQDLKELRSARPDTAFAREEFGDWDLPERAAPADTGLPAFDEPAPRRAEPPMAPPPVTLPPPVALEPKAPVRAEFAPPPDAPRAAPLSAAPAGAPLLADAFSSLLAAEEGRPHKPVPLTAFVQMPVHAVPAAMPPGHAAADLSDEAIDKIVDKVVARLGAGVRGTVLDLAERLVRSEIDRLKAMR